MQEQKYSIRHWAKDERPREKLLLKGPENLSDAELLAILIHHGTRERSAVELARDIYKLWDNNLAELGKVTARELMRIKGIGKAKAISVVAALELGKRRQAAIFLEKTAIKSSRQVANYLQTLLKDYRQEVFAVLFLNQAHRVNHFEILSKGGITSTVIDQRVILKKALEVDAVTLVLCHNHPSGSLKPSKADEELTRMIRQAADLLNIRILDHLIVSDSGYYSFADDGKL